MTTYPLAPDPADAWDRPSAPGRRARPVLHALTLGLCLLHGAAIWLGMGGAEGLSHPWPLARHDHPLYFHSTIVTRDFLRQSGTTAGYDPYFMAGYAKSVVYPASSTLPELVVFLFGGDRPAQAYKLYVLASASLLPWLLAWAGLAWRARPGAIFLAVFLFLVYLWTDFPINYAEFGMLPYLLAIPLGLLATATVTGYLDRGGWPRWLASALGCSLVVLVHLTAAMVVAPAAALAYLVAVLAPREGRRFPISRHLGVWLIPVVVLAANAFWWLPGVWLSETKGDSTFAFSHSGESLIGRLAQIGTVMPPIEGLLWALGLPGLVVLARRDRVAAAGLAGLSMAGFGWGYLAGASEALDFLQPGRHTYALYTALAMASGLALSSLLAPTRSGRSRGNAVLGALAATVLVLILGAGLVPSVRARINGPEPFLSSRPPARLLWVVDRVREHVEPGGRLLYEEGGFDVPGQVDPFRGGRYSGLLPHLAGVEVLGGPYLHAALRTNFTQFGEGKLFGRDDWDREHFVRYAELYRPSAIVCWSPGALEFCRSNPDLIEVLDREAGGPLLIGRVKGFEGDAIRGRAEVGAEPGRLLVREASPELDGLVVLRYHFVPYLRSRPTVPLEPVLLGDDPVPFIGFRPGEGPLVLELQFPPERSGRGR